MKKFFVCVFFEYKVNYHCDYSYLAEYGDICSDKVDKVYTCDGSHLMQTIISLLSNKLLISFACNGDTFYIEHFNPDYGTGANFTIMIEKVIEEK